MGDDMQLYSLGPVGKSEEEDELAIKLVKRLIKNKKHRKTILQVLGLEPYEWQGKHSKHGRYGTKK